MISMRALECLVAIVEQGSLTQAAAVLHISQPALSHQIAAIERELGTPVIERLPRGIRPTAAGWPRSPRRGSRWPRPTGPWWRAGGWRPGPVAASASPARRR